MFWVVQRTDVERFGVLVMLQTFVHLAQFWDEERLEEVLKDAAQALPVHQGQFLHRIA